MIIKYPEHAHVPLLRELWQEAFGDSESYLDDFFRTAFAPHRCLTAWEAGQLAAAAYWLPCSCRGREGAYLYAVATVKAYRGRGFCHSLLEEVHRLLRAQGCAMAVLVPGEDSLYTFYEAMGYKPFGGLTEVFATASGLPAELREVSSREYAALRREYLPAGGILQEGVTLDFLETQVSFYAGAGYILCARVEEGTLFAPELLGNGDPGGILQTLGCREGTFRRPGREPFALWLALRETTPPEYFSFALD